MVYILPMLGLLPYEPIAENNSKEETVSEMGLLKVSIESTEYNHIDHNK